MFFAEKAACSFLTESLARSNLATPTQEDFESVFSESRSVMQALDWV